MTNWGVGLLIGFTLGFSLAFVIAWLIHEYRYANHKR